MTSWLDSLRAALDASDQPVAFFTRDDDAGWGDRKLFAMLDVFENVGVPVDLAAIPAHLNANCAAELVRRRERFPGLRIHQHGFAHINHEAEGRKCEFGLSRDSFRQQADIRQGKDRLLAYLGVTDPIFTPPWNRCTQQTVEALAREDFQILSRESRAAPLDLSDIRSVSVSIDWRRERDGVRASPDEAVASLAAQIRVGACQIGLMLHHDTLDSEDLALLGELFALLRGARRISCTNIVELGNHLHAVN